MKKYLITWPNGDQEIIEGATIIMAMINNGYGHVKSADFKYTENKDLIKKYIDENFIDCPDCNGEESKLSECCGAPMDSDIMICSDCKEHADFQRCETCEGEGKIKKEAA